MLSRRAAVPHKAEKYVTANGNFRGRDHHRERRKIFIHCYTCWQSGDAKQGAEEKKVHCLATLCSIQLFTSLTLPKISTVWVISRGSRVAIWLEEREREKREKGRR